MYPQLLYITQVILGAIVSTTLYFGIVYILHYVVSKLWRTYITPAVEFVLLYATLVIGVVLFLCQLYYGESWLSYIYSKVYYISATAYAHYVQLIIVVLYMLMAMYKCINIIRLQLTYRQSAIQPYYNNAIQVYIQAQAAKLHIAIPKLYTTLRPTTPYTSGLVHNIIILPIALLNTLTVAELQAVIMHELAHIVRKDVWLHKGLLLMHIIIGHIPLVSTIITRAKYVRELACDDWVISNKVPHTHYATALHAAAYTHIQGTHWHVAMYVPKHQLLCRIKRLYNVQSHSSYSIPWGALCSSILLIWCFAYTHGSYTHIQLVSTAANWPSKYHTVAPLTTTLAQPTQVAVAKRINVIPKPTATYTAPTAPISNSVIPVSSTNELRLYTEYAKHSTTIVADYVLSLSDSISIYNHNITINNIHTATGLPLQAVLNGISSASNNDTLLLSNAIILTQPATITVTQANGMYNAVFNNVQLLQSGMYDAATQEWTILQKLVQAHTLLASRTVLIKKIKKLATLSL